jgi:hypothetical protein
MERRRALPSPVVSVYSPRVQVCGPTAWPSDVRLSYVPSACVACVWKKSVDQLLDVVDGLYTAKSMAWMCWHASCARGSTK